MANKKNNGGSAKKVGKSILIGFGVILGISACTSIADGIHQAISPEYRLEVEKQKVENEKVEQDKLAQQEIEKAEKEAKQSEEKAQKEAEKAEQEKVKAMENALNVDTEKGDSYEFTVEKLNVDDEKESLIVTINHSENTYVYFNETTFKSDIENTMKWVRDKSDYNVEDFNKIKIIINIKVYDSYGELIDMQLVNYKITTESLNKIKFDTFMLDNLDFVGELNVNKAISF